MITLRDHKVWDRVNGLLSVSQYPKKNQSDDKLWVMLNGNTGNFCLDYSEDEFDRNISHQRAWSSDTGYYVKLGKDEKVIVTRWWDGYTEEVPEKRIQENLPKFYTAITNHDQKSNSGVVAFAKGAFITLRNCIQQKDNGHASIRAFMYLLAALEQGVQDPKKVDRSHWHLEDYDSSWISKGDWEWIYQSFLKGTINIPPLVDLILRHASNRLFQEAHREATRRDAQLVMFGGIDRKYDGQVLESAFYTPTPLIRTLVQETLWALDKAKPLVNRKSLKILDPSCGSSEFLRETLRQLKMKNYKGTVQVTGWDISPIACEMSNFVLHYESNTEWKGKVSIEIDKGDSSNKNWTEKGFFDIVLMNPPFKTFEKLGNQKQFVLSELQGFATRQPDLAALFWKKAAEAVATDGVLGLVLPHSLLGAETYENLRVHITQELGFKFTLIGRLGSAGLFENAMIIPSILVGTKNSAPINTVLWTDHQQNSVYNALREFRKYRLEPFPIPVITSGFNIFENKNVTEENPAHAWIVRPYSVYQLRQKLQNVGRVSDVFKVTRGVDTGNNPAFIITKQEWESLLTKKQKDYFRPCIMRETIANGRLNDNLYIFYPYGDYEIASEDELPRKLGDYYKLKLLPHKESLKTRRGREQKWWELNERRPWQLEPIPKLVSSQFGKSNLFVFDKAGDFIVGQSIAWLLKNEDVDKNKFYFAYLGLLNAPLIDTLLQMVCNVLEGGYYDMSKRYVNNMPLPDLTKSDVQLVNQLVIMGKKIHEGKTVDPDALNQIAADAYGVDVNIFTLESEP